MNDTVDTGENQDAGSDGDAQRAQLFEDLRHALADEYEVERELGEGGMAFVFLAHDIKHDRKVAIKILKPELASSIGAERFLREIKTAAKLNHPHILPLFDSGAADGLLYYVMPFVEGESLADYLRREKQLAIEEAVRIAREVAEGLSVAHSVGLVHRDIKPQNVMMTGGHAVVADFGIARAIDQAGGEKLTRTGMTVGTPAYMSPEQAAGDPDLDGRADIYSLGCMLYEMLVGQIPYTAPSPVAMIARHTLDHPTPPHIMRESIPPDLENIVFVAMEKTPADRFHTARDFVEALKAFEQGAAIKLRRSTLSQRAAPARYGTVSRQFPWWRKAAVPAGIGVVVLAVGLLISQFAFGGNDGRSSTAVAASSGLDPARIAVLYFDDLSTDGSLGYVADGLTEGLISQLSGVSGLNVVSRSGVEQFRDTNISSDSIAQLLQTGSLVTGSVEPAGDRLRVTARLVDGMSGAPIGRQAASFVVPENAVLTALDSVARDVSRTLRELLGQEVAMRERRAGATSTAAWVLLQRAEKFRKDAGVAASSGDHAQALALVTQADSLLIEAERADANWNEPLILRARLLWSRAWLVRRDPPTATAALDTGIALATRAADRDPSDARALEVRGELRYRAWQLDLSPGGQSLDQLLEQAYRDLEAAVRADPTLATAHATLSRLHYQRDGGEVEAMLAARRAYEADAYLRNAAEVLDRLHVVSYDLANFREAQRWCDEGTRRFPGDSRFVNCHLWMLITPDAPTAIDSAWQLAEHLDSLTSEASRPFWSRLYRQVVAGVIGRAGLLDSARTVLVSVRTDDPEIDPEHELVGNEAMVRTLIGDRDEAIEMLMRYVVMNPDHTFERAGSIMWWWLPLRDHPEFEHLLTVR